MTTTDPTLVETLLNMAESDVLDFKRDQYPFAGATDDQKSELVKDIVAFSNAWKTDDAHIFIGVDENPGGRATVVGVTGQLNDADVQQLVNTKTNVPIAFEYIPLTADGKPAAIIRIKKAQQRPVFLKRAFGRLKPNVVYVRRGSSTAEAAPDEIARMGASAVTGVDIPVLEVELAHPEERRCLGISTTLTSRLLAERPPLAPAPLEIHTQLSRQFGLATQIHSFAKQFESPVFRKPGPDPKELAAYRRKLGLLQQVGFFIKNTGRLLVQDVRVVLDITKVNGLTVVDELPEKPRSPLDFFVPVVHGIRLARTTDVKDLGASWEVEARFDKIQPTATAWSKPFWIGSERALELPLVARVYGDNIPKAIDVPIQITIDVAEGDLNLDDEGEDGDQESP